MPFPPPRPVILQCLFACLQMVSTGLLGDKRQAWGNLCKWLIPQKLNYLSAHMTNPTSAASADRSQEGHTTAAAMFAHSTEIPMAGTFCRVASSFRQWFQAASDRATHPRRPRRKPFLQRILGRARRLTCSVVAVGVDRYTMSLRYAKRANHTELARFARYELCDSR